MLDSTTVASAVDTVLVYTSHTDTIAVPYLTYHARSVRWEAAQLAVPVLVAVLGWYWVHRLNRRAQREHFFHEIVHATSQSVSEEMAEYARWSAWRAALLQALYDRGVLQREKATELAELVKLPVAHRWLLLIEGSRFVLDGVVVDDLVSQMEALGARHSAIGALCAQAVDEKRVLVERMASRDEARTQCLSLCNDVNAFRLEMLRRVTCILKPQSRASVFKRRRSPKERGRNP